MESWWFILDTSITANKCSGKCLIYVWCKTIPNFCPHLTKKIMVKASLLVVKHGETQHVPWSFHHHFVLGKICPPTRRDGHLGHPPTLPWQLKTGAKSSTGKWPSVKGKKSTTYGHGPCSIDFNSSLEKFLWFLGVHIFNHSWMVYFMNFMNNPEAWMRTGGSPENSPGLHRKTRWWIL